METNVLKDNMSLEQNKNSTLRGATEGTYLLYNKESSQSKCKLIVSKSNKVCILEKSEETKKSSNSKNCFWKFLMILNS